MINTTVKLLDEYNITFEGRSRIFVDGANPSIIRSLKERIDEDPDYEKIMAFYKKSYPSVYDLEFLQQKYDGYSCPFAKYHREMLAHTKEMMEYRNGYVAINPTKHNKLITALRTAVEKGDSTLNKEATNHDDLFDSFRLSLQFQH
jgi:hypothetical protein